MNSEFYDTDIFIIPESENPQPILSENIELCVFCRALDLQANNELLHNILKAVNYTEGNNAHIFKLKDSESINVARSINPSVQFVLSFGLRPRDLGFNAGFKANRFYKTEDFSILLTHSLAQLNGEKKYKMALWNALQSTLK